MNQKKIGEMLKTLRREKNLTQTELAEKLGVSNRSISRWENGITMPDFDLFIELADFYDVDVREIMDGERKGGCMDAERKEEMLLAADYTSQETKRLTMGLRYMFIYSLGALTVNMILAELEIHSFLSGFLDGTVAGTMIVGILLTSKYMAKIRQFKLRLLNRRKQS
jgi:transcriptional regulator with XRE-family HTH domain